MTSSQSLRDPPGRARRRVGPQGELEEPILAELFSVERLEQHAQTLAAADRITETPRVGHAMRSRGSPTTAGSSSSRTASSPGRSRTSAAITPAAEWLVDNFHDRRRAAPRDPRRPAAGLLPRAAQARRRPSRGLPAGPRPRLGLHRPHRQPLRSREPAPDGPRLPGGRAADDRRAVGDRDQPAHPARREPPPAGRADRRAAGRPASRPTSSPTACSALGPDDAGEAAAALRRLSRATLSDGGPGPALPAPARPGPGGHARPPLARGAARRAGHDRRGDGPPRAPAPGDDERDRPQRDHEHAPDLVVRLGRVRRERQPRRRGPARSGARSGRWTSRRATATGTPIEELARGLGPAPRSRSPGRRPTWPTRHGREAARPDRRADAARTVGAAPRRPRLLPHLGRPARLRAEPRLSASRCSIAAPPALRPRGDAPAISPTIACSTVLPPRSCRSGCLALVGRGECGPRRS